MDFHAKNNHLYIADSQKLKIERQNIEDGTKEDFLSKGKGMCSYAAKKLGLDFVIIKVRTNAPQFLLCNVYNVLSAGMYM
jgi:hypothetical protein